MHDANGRRLLVSGDIIRAGNGTGLRQRFRFLDQLGGNARTFL